MSSSLQAEATRSLYTWQSSTGYIGESPVSAGKDDGSTGSEYGLNRKGSSDFGYWILDFGLLLVVWSPYPASSVPSTICKPCSRGSMPNAVHTGSMKDRPAARRTSTPASAAMR